MYIHKNHDTQVIASSPHLMHYLSIQSEFALSPGGDIHQFWGGYSNLTLTLPSLRLRSLTGRLTGSCGTFCSFGGGLLRGRWLGSGKWGVLHLCNNLQTESET